MNKKDVFKYLIVGILGLIFIITSSLVQVNDSCCSPDILNSMIKMITALIGTVFSLYFLILLTGVVSDNENGDLQEKDKK